MRFTSLYSFVLVVLLSGCASITAGTTQSVAVDTNPQKAADCRLSNEKGTWSVRTPGVTTVTKANGPLSASCATTDGWGGSTAVQSTTAGAAFGNIVAGGIIGAAVDMSSGAAYIYPAQIIVPLGQGSAAGTVSAALPPQSVVPPQVTPQQAQTAQETPSARRNYNRPASHSTAKPD